MKRTREETVDAMKRQISALRASGASFDNGNKWEAIRLAACTYVLVHDGGKRNRSILTQLGVRGQIRFISTGQLQPNNLLSDTPLVHMRLQSHSAEYFAPLAEALQHRPIKMQFPQWWEDPIIKDQRGRTLSRKNLVHSLRDQEGGGHFDEHLTDETYIGIAKNNSVGWLITNETTAARPIDPGPHLATMRQLAWEIEFSITEHFRNDIDDWTIFA